MQVIQRSSPETLWCVVVIVVMVNEVMSLSGPNVCMVQQKYNITKRVKYRAPMSIRTYEWCFSMPPRCSKWSTEMRDLTRLEVWIESFSSSCTIKAKIKVVITEERTAEVAVCCPGYKMKDVSCVPICPNGKMGQGCLDDCPPDKWGPNCVNECPECLNGFCVPSTGECDCEEGWQGESCQVSMSTTQAAPALMEELLTTTKSTIKTLPTTTSTLPTTKVTFTEIVPITSNPEITTMTITSTRMTVTSTETTKTTPLFISTTLPTKSTSLYYNVTLTPFTTEWLATETTQMIANVTVSNFIYNRTETPEEDTSNIIPNEHVTTTMLKIPITVKPSKDPLTPSSSTTTITTTTPTTTSTSTTISKSVTKSAPILSLTTPNVTIILTDDVVKTEVTKKPEITTKNHFTTLKFKYKEIWIKPTQKGDPVFIEPKIKSNHEITKLKSATNTNEASSENTTKKTIIVSIIPTSVSHATFKKIALTTSSYVSHKTNATIKLINKTEQSYTKSMTPQVTATPFTIKFLSTLDAKNLSSPKITNSFSHGNKTLKVTAATKKVFLNTTTLKKHTSTTMATSMTTNSMSSTLNAISEKLNSSTSVTNKPSTNKQSMHKSSIYEVTTDLNKKLKLFVKDEAINKTSLKLHKNVTTKVEINKPMHEAKNKTSLKEKTLNIDIKTNGTKSPEQATTQEPSEDETFHILTEPEHITAVINDKERDHTSLDLIPVISIAGGVMMAVITVAVIIVMIERCKRPRYDDVRKINDIRMQVMIDNKDVPSPYVRSIFHTPLPDPPSPDNCHYQPISTLDRNLKQFMRPVVVQNISPIMLENFRGILECHYDHLPNRRNHEFGTMPVRCSVSPSVRCDNELLRQRPLSVADYTIEALKCEAKLNMIDSTTSEPLYAEIPCWRPPSEHAIEVVNLNGEAVTEL